MSEPASPGEPVFLTLDEVLQIHTHQIESFGGSSSIRDLGLLESAIAQPRQRYGGRWLHPDLAAMAAAYLFHITRNHAFVDGNKRTGTQAASLFLRMNGFDVDYPLRETEKLVLAVAEGSASKDQVIKFFRKLLAGD
ncbi:MAG: type II toxin-antitoxin system death-on-curing family toxin [Phycisphaeraceae bacterium]